MEILELKDIDLSEPPTEQEVEFEKITVQNGQVNIIKKKHYADYN
jgi:hypothetical protein